MNHVDSCDGTSLGFLSDIIPYVQYIHDFAYKLRKQHAGEYACHTD